MVAQICTCPNPWNLIFVSLGCHNGTPQTGGLNLRNLFLTVFNLGSPKLRCQQGRFHSEGSSLGYRQLLFAVCSRDFFFVCTCSRERVSKLSGVSSCKGTIPSWGLYLHLPLITSQRPHLQIPSHWGQDFKIWIGSRRGKIQFSPQPLVNKISTLSLPPSGTIPKP